MHKPLKLPIHLRVWQLIRGLLFYNTVYWRRASDGLTMTSLSQEERDRQRPERNLEIIRPRVHPRAHLEAAARTSEISDPPENTPSEMPAETLLDRRSGTEKNGHRGSTTEEIADGTGRVYVKRRRYRRRLVSRTASGERDSFIARVFGKK